ncbi:TetR/AcrR family transcriptional regulator [bacterium]|nr:TetR/AcrR family transcriptional regulator [bacterium]
MSAASPGPRRRLSAAERREQILGAAAGIFAESAYAATRTRAIAEACGIQESLLFRHFRTKEELFLAVLTTRMAEHDQTDFLRGLPADLDPIELFRRIATRILELGDADPQLFRLLIGAAIAGTPQTQSLYVQWRLPFVAFLEERIRAGIAAGEFREVDARLSARAFVGMVMDCVLSCDLWSRLGYDGTTPDDLVNNNVPTYVQGLLAGPPPERR